MNDVNKAAESETKRHSSGSALNCLVMFFRVMATPGCWIRNRLTNKEWDRKVLDLLEKGQFSEVGQYTVKLGGEQIWVKNYPYEFGYNAYTTGTGMPSRSTVFKLKDAINRIET